METLDEYVGSSKTLFSSATPDVAVGWSSISNGILSLAEFLKKAPTNLKISYFLIFIERKKSGKAINRDNKNENRIGNFSNRKIYRPLDYNKKRSEK